MPASCDTTVSTLYDHYKESFQQVRRYTDTRNRLFVYLLLGVTAMQLLNPEEAQSVLGQILMKYAGVSPKLTMQSAATSLWIAVVYGLIRYYQTTLTVDLQYESLHEVEGRLASSLSSPEFRRERHGYDTKFKGFRRATWCFYRVAIPVALILCLVSRLLSEYSYAGSVTLGLLLDGSLCLCAVGVTVLYVYESLAGGDDT